MEYTTADGHVVTNEQLEAEAKLFERGERPDGWQDAKETASTSSGAES